MMTPPLIAEVGDVDEIVDRLGRVLRRYEQSLRSQRLLT